MDNMMPLFRALPVPLFLCGLVRSIMELLEVSRTAASLAMGADDISSMRWITYSAYLRALDSLFFYAAIAALVAFAAQYEKRAA